MIFIDWLIITVVDFNDQLPYKILKEENFKIICKNRTEKKTHSFTLVQMIHKCTEHVVVIRGVVRVRTKYRWIFLLHYG